MIGNTLRLGRLFGIELKLDYSWFIVFTLIAWSLAGHYFPMTHPGWSAGTYWAMGAVTALLFFGSVVAHELAHSFLSQAHGVPVRDITLCFSSSGRAPSTSSDRRLRTPRGRRGGSRWLRVLIGLVAHQAVWELAAESYVGVSSRHDRRRSRSRTGRAIYAILWSVIALCRRRYRVPAG